LNKTIKTTLKKYKKGKTIESENDLPILERYAATGMVFFYIEKDKKTSKIEPKAKLTDMSKWFVTQL
jgi:hypothetical protein